MPRLKPLAPPDRCYQNFISRLIYSILFTVLTTTECWIVTVFKGAKHFMVRKHIKPPDSIFNGVKREVKPKKQGNVQTFFAKSRDPTELRRRAHGNSKPVEPPANVLQFPK